MNKIVHPLNTNTKVQFLSPRCPCSGSRFAVTTGTIQRSQKLSNGKYSYTILGERKNIPEEGIIKVLGM